MNSHFRTSLVAALAAGLTLSAFNFPAEAAPSQRSEVQNGANSTLLSARKRHHHVRHYYNGERAALRTFGLIAGSIASIAAANEWRDHCGYYDCGYYGGYYGYGYAPRYYYYYHRPYWHHRWNPGYSYRYNHYRHSVHIHP